MKQRKCQGCKQLKNADLMHKITREYKSGEVFLNPSSKILGRSAYVCKNKDCIKKVLKKKTIKQVLRTNETEKIEQQLLDIIEEQ